MTFNNKKYSNLLASVMPRVIKSRKEYNRLEAVFAKLFDKGEKLTPEEDALFDLLANLLEEYESRTLPPLEPLTPVEMLRAIMEQNDLKQAELAEIFGGQSNLSAILNGKREISKSQAKKLGERFKLSPAAFI